MSRFAEKNRVVRLAQKYGPFARFSPEGNEGEDALASAIKEGEKADEEKWDKERQRADEEKANAKKARESLAEREAELESAQSENEALKQQLEDAQAKATSAGIELTELNEDEWTATDKVLVRTINALRTKIEASDKEIKGLKTKAREYEDQAAKEAAKKVGDANYNELLSDLDTEYGADCRNDAVKAFNKMIADGEVPKGKPAKATRILEKCYRDVKAAKDKSDKSVKLDSGSGGGAPRGLSGIELKKGSLDEVYAQAKAASATS